MLSGHPPFGAEARNNRIDFSNEGNCSIPTTGAADTWLEERIIGRLREVCDRWIYGACLLFALALEERKRSACAYSSSNPGPRWN